MILTLVSVVFLTINFTIGANLRGLTSVLLIPIFMSMLLLNSLGFHKMVCIVISIVPCIFVVLPPLFVGGTLQGTSKNYYIVLLALSQVPFLLFRERQDAKPFYACMVINFSCLFFYNLLIHFTDDLDFNTWPFWGDKIKEVFCFILTSSIVWFKAHLSETYSENLNSLNDSLQTRNEEIRLLALQLKKQHDLLDNQFKLLEHRNIELAENQASLAHLITKIESNTEVLLELATSHVLTSGEFEEATRLITQKAADVLGISRVSIWMYDKKMESILCQNLYQASEGTHTAGGEIFAQTHPTYFATLKLKKPIIASDAHHNSYTSEYVNNYLIPFDIKSLLDTPFFLKGELRGVICFEQQNKYRHWTAEDIYFAQALADLVTLAYESLDKKKAQEEISFMNADLEQKVWERTRELHARNKTLEEYSFYVSHVLRSPLSGMLGLLKLLEMDKSQLSDPEFISKIGESAKNVDVVVRELNVKLSQDPLS